MATISMVSANDNFNAMVNNNNMAAPVAATEETPTITSIMPTEAKPVAFKLFGHNYADKDVTLQDVIQDAKAGLQCIKAASY